MDRGSLKKHKEELPMVRATQITVGSPASRDFQRKTDLQLEMPWAFVLRTPWVQILALPGMGP